MSAPFATIAQHPDGFILTGERFKNLSDEEKSKWSLLAFDQHRLLLQKSPVNDLFQKVESGYCVVTPEVFKAQLLGLVQGNYSGVVIADTERGVKRIFFEEGQITFASSNQLDDRLGEVIYRHGLINMEQMTQSAVEVTRSLKFGQVLLNSGIFQPAQLWWALQTQVREIIKSLFLVPQVAFQVQPKVKSPITISMNKNSGQIFEEACSYGISFRSFIALLTNESTMGIPNNPAWLEPDTGTFEQDIIELVRKENRIMNLIGASKLSDIYTLLALFHFSSLNVISPHHMLPHPSIEGCAELKALIDSYHALIGYAKDLLQSCGKSLPEDQLNKVAMGLSFADFGLSPGFDGRFHNFSVLAMSKIWQENFLARGYLVRDLRTLISFATQLSIDLLPQNLSVQLKSRIATNQVA